MDETPVRPSADDLSGVVATPHPIPADSAPERIGEAAEAAGVMPASQTVDPRQVTAECMRTMLAASGSEKSLDEVLDLVATEAMRWLAPSDLIICSLDPATGALVIQAAHGFQTDIGIADMMMLGEAALAHAMTACQPTLFLANDAAPVLKLDTTRLAAVLAVPALDSDDIYYGGILLYYVTLPQLSTVEFELAGLFGAQAALALRQAHRKAQDHMAVVMNERNRIARDLHDSVTQALYTISLITESLPEVWQDHQAEAIQSVETLRMLARSALAEMRTLLLELRTSEQADTNLGDLLRQLPERMFIRPPLQITTTVVGNTPLPKPVQVALYRIAQEALNNVNKHAHATRAAIQLDYQGDAAVILRVSDNGCGIALHPQSSSQLGFGIMRERAQEIGAELTIESQVGRGTQVAVSWHARR